MQNFSDTKQKKIVDDLIEIDRNLQSIDFDNNECKIRQLVDCRRQLLANYKSILQSSGATRGASSNPQYNPSKFLPRRLQKWRSRVTLLESSKQSFENPGFCDQILDSVLPETWDFNSDVLLIVTPASNTIVSKAINRRQRFIVIFDQDECIVEGALVDHSTANIAVCRTITDVEIAFATLQTPAEQVITLPCSLDPKFLKETKGPLAEAIRKGKRNRFANTMTANKFGASWSRNLLENLHLIAEAPNIKQLSVEGVKDAVIVGSGPSLNKNVQTLATIQNKVFIVAALRSLQTLHEANIKPDLVIQLDAEDDHVAQEFSKKLDIEIENFLIELTVNPWFLKTNVKNFIWSYPSIFGDVSERFGVAPTPFDAPSVAIYGLTLCYLLGFESLCFVGQDLASSGESQYAKGATSLLPAHNDISAFNIEVDGFYGDRVMTRGAYHGQLLRCQNIASELQLKAPHIKLFNATEGGAYIKGFEHLSLSEFASIQDLKINDQIKQIIWRPSTSIKKTEVRDYKAQLSKILDQISSIANKIIELDTATAKKADNDAAIAALLNKFQNLNGKTSLLQIAMQEEISSVIGTSRNTKERRRLSDFFEKLLRHCEILKSVAGEQNS